MYSNKRSLEILEFDFWLYDGVPDSPGSMYGNEEMGDAEDGRIRRTPTAAHALTDLTENQEDAEYIFDTSSETLLKRRA